MTQEAAQVGEVYTFVNDLPGLPGCRRFLVECRDQGAQVYRLMSLDSPDLVLIAIKPEALGSRYRPRLSREDLVCVNAEPQEHLLSLVVLTVPQGDGEVTANLRAPLILNRSTHTGRQAILAGQDYSSCQPLTATGSGCPVGP